MSVTYTTIPCEYYLQYVVCKSCFWWWGFGETVWSVEIADGFKKSFKAAFTADKINSKFDDWKRRYNTRFFLFEHSKQEFNFFIVWLK